jgi:hypothetical protein
MQVSAQAVTGSVDALVRKVALAVDQAVVIATPVDTGRARSNWIVTLDSPATGEIPAHAPGSKGGTGGANAQAAINAGKQVISRYKDSNSKICITNNLDYIEDLNNGTSAQAPAGFVEQAVAAGANAVQGATIVITTT